MLSWRVLSSVLVASLLGACVVTLPPPPTPARRASAVALPADAPAAGDGRVVIDTVDGAATAELITGRAMAQGAVGGQVANGTRLATRRLCTTPCVVDLPRGEHEVVLWMPGTSRTGQVVVKVEERPSMLVASLGQREQHAGTKVAGWTLVLGGLSSISFGMGAMADEDSGGGMTTVIGIGAAVTAIGALLIYSARSTEQDTSYAQYPIE